MAGSECAPLQRLHILVTKLESEPSLRDGSGRLFSTPATPQDIQSAVSCRRQAPAAVGVCRSPQGKWDSATARRHFDKEQP